MHSMPAGCGAEICYAANRFRDIGCRIIAKASFCNLRFFLKIVCSAEARTTEGCDLVLDGFARVQHPQGRPVLNGEIVELDAFDPEPDRWECVFGDGHGLRLCPAKLSPV